MPGPGRCPQDTPPAALFRGSGARTGMGKEHQLWGAHIKWGFLRIHSLGSLIT